YDVGAEYPLQTLAVHVDEPGLPSQHTRIVDQTMKRSEDAINFVKHSEDVLFLRNICLNCHSFTTLRDDSVDNLACRFRILQIINNNRIALFRTQQRRGGTYPTACTSNEHRFHGSSMVSQYSTGTQKTMSFLSDEDIHSPQLPVDNIEADTANSIFHHVDCSPQFEVRTNLVFPLAVNLMQQNVGDSHRAFKELKKAGKYSCFILLHRNEAVHAFQLPGVISEREIQLSALYKSRITSSNQFIEFVEV